MLKSPGVLLALMVGGLSTAVQADTECSATVPCAEGCCGTYGVCGLGPDYCGADNCINNCDAKAECDPDNWGSDYVSSTTCPLNVCCSKYGFCGTTDEFCGTSTVTRPSCDIDSQSITRVIGYYGSGATTRSCNGMLPASIPQGVYSHIFFGFASIDPDTFEVVPASAADYDTWTKLQALKVRDLDLELWLSIGGWDFSDDGSATATTFSDLAAADITYQNVFFSSLNLLLMSYGFTGVDIDWEYPAASDRNGRDEDFENFPVFLANLKSALSDYKFGLSITLPTSYWYLQHFDLVSIEPHVDWFNYMSYDLHGTWDIGNQWSGAYLDAHTNLTEIETALDLLWRNDIPSSKVNLGLAFYGRSFTVSSESCTTPGCVYLSAGDAGVCSAQAGILLNGEIGTIVNDNALTPTLYSDAAVKVITWGNQWVSYDDQDTFKLKGDFAKSQCLGGVLVWAVDYDDGNGTYSYGLAAALGNELNVDTDTGITLTISHTSSDTDTSGISEYCRWMNCGDSCPSGYSEITRGDETSQIMLDSSYCDNDQLQVLCCPTSTELPTCRWRGFHNSGRCQNGCSSGETEVGSTSAGCSYGYQSACCTITESTTPYADCKWYSDAPDCTDGSADSCPSDYPTFVAKSRNGWGGMRLCNPGRYHSYCCKGSTVPDAFTNCDWYGHEGESYTNEAYCSDSCPSDTMRIAAQYVGGLYTGSASDCLFGNEAYCCSGPKASSSTEPRSVPLIYQDQTAEEFDGYLQHFLEDPECPGEWDAQYDDTVQLSTKRDSLLQLLRERATDQTSTLSVLLPMMSALFAARYTRSDIQEIWDLRMSDYFGNEAATFDLIYDTMYPNGYTGYPLDDPDWFLSDLICNIEDSTYGTESYGQGSAAVCINTDDIATVIEWEDPGTSTKRSIEEASLSNNTTSAAVNASLQAITVSGSVLQRRKFGANSMNPRTRNQIEPTVSAAMNGVILGQLTLSYIRWLRPSAITEVILELAFWIGPTAGAAPSSSIQATYADRSHTTQRDRWVVFHFHVPLDDRTFIRRNGNTYLGVTHGRVYHSQEVVQPAAVSEDYTADMRAEYRHSSSYVTGAASTNPTGQRNSNERSAVWNCPVTVQGIQRRWYFGSGLASNDVPETYARQFGYEAVLQRFGNTLYTAGVVNFEILNRLWPTLTAATTGDLINNADGLKGVQYYRITGNGARYSPVAGAFDINTLPNGATPLDLSNADP